MSDTAALKRHIGMYPERRGSSPTKLEHIWHDHVLFYRALLAGKHTQFSKVLQTVKPHGKQLSGFDDERLKKELQNLRRDLRLQGPSFTRICRTFAATGEMAYRNLGRRYHDVQLKGGWAMLHGNIAEMGAGEGKTLTATLTACTLGMAGIPTHVITANEYLAERDYRSLKPLYDSMGISSALIKHDLPSTERRQAYLCDVVYCTARELIFDYLKDRLLNPQRSGRITHAVQRLYGGFGNLQNLYLRGLHFAIIDEADTVLIDQALTPVVITGDGNTVFEEAAYRQALRFARQLVADTDFVIDGGGLQIDFTDQGSVRCAELSSEAGGFWNVTKIRELLLLQALTALHGVKRDVHYSVQSHTIAPMDGGSGNPMFNRLWASGLQQMVECKEGCPMTSQKDTLARITFQRFFRRYHHLAGMTNTAREIRRQLWSLYRLKVAVIPPSRPAVSRKMADSCSVTSEEKLVRLVSRAGKLYQAGRPIVIGTPSLEAAWIISERLDQSNLPHEVIGGMQDEAEAATMTQAGQPGRITVAAGSAGLGTNITLEPDAAAAGGLHFMVSEKNRYRRLDRQLVGRCGSQGEPGTYSLHLSLEDELFQTISTPLIPDLLSFFLKKFPAIGKYLAVKTGQLVQKQMARRHHHSCRTMLRHEDALDRQLAFSGEGE